MAELTCKELINQLNAIVEEHPYLLDRRVHMLTVGENADWLTDVEIDAFEKDADLTVSLVADTI